MNKEAQAKIQSLRDQTASAAHDSKTRLEKRINEIKADYQARSQKLAQAWQLTVDALAA